MILKKLKQHMNFLSYRTYRKFSWLYDTGDKKEYKVTTTKQSMHFMNF